MLYVILICITAFLTHKFDKLLFFVKYENNVKFIDNAVFAIMHNEPLYEKKIRRSHSDRSNNRVTRGRQNFDDDECYAEGEEEIFN